MREGGVEFFVDGKRVVVKEKAGRARLLRKDFDVLPRYPAAPARAESLQGSLFGGEAGGVMLRGRRTARFAVGAFMRCENALDKARRALNDGAHAPDFDNVYANGNNHG